MLTMWIHTAILLPCLTSSFSVPIQRLTPQPITSNSRLKKTVPTNLDVYFRRKRVKLISSKAKFIALKKPSENCEHEELIDCDNYVTNDMECMITATGMPCCICTGQLKKKRFFNLFFKILIFSVHCYQLSQQQRYYFCCNLQFKQKTLRPIISILNL
uniref:Secreted protein n=1 Tax=Syphacia muris TaxID=451379 RepID=A0A0N5AZK1_9BILA